MANIANYHSNLIDLTESLAIHIDILTKTREQQIPIRKYIILHDISK